MSGTHKFPSFSELTFAVEGGNSSDVLKVHWPESDASGVTLGAGYDMGNRSKAEVKADLVAAGVPAADAEKLSAGAGKKGNDAKNWVAANVGTLPKITKDVAKTLYEKIYPTYVDKAKTRVADNGGDWSKYPTVMKEVLVDLAYRGDLSTKHPRLIACIKENDYADFCALIHDLDYWQDNTNLKKQKPKNADGTYTANQRGGYNWRIIDRSDFLKKHADDDDDEPANDEPHPDIVYREPTQEFDLATMSDDMLYDHLRDAWKRAQKRFGNEGKAEYDFQDENGRVNVLSARGFDHAKRKPVPSTNTKYDDCMFLVYKTKEGTKKVSLYQCTTEWTIAGSSSVLLLGQHKYALGNHGISRYATHVSLKDVKKRQDLSKKNYRALRPNPTVRTTLVTDENKVGQVGETSDKAYDAGDINIHYGGDTGLVPADRSGAWSAGCQVIAGIDKYLEFIKIVESDASIKGTINNELSDKPSKDGTRSLIYTLVEGDFLAPSSTSAGIVFPIVGKDAEAHYSLNEGGEGGFFPIGANNFWHGGIHLDASGDAVQAIADGDVVAYRINKKALEVKLLDETMRYSNGFVLVRHERYTPKGAKLELFSLAVHLLPFEEYGDAQKKNPPAMFKKHVFTIATSEDAGGLNVRKAGKGTDVLRVAKLGEQITFKNPNAVAPGGKLVDGWYELAGGGTVYVRTGDKPSVKYEFKLEPEKLDQVVNCKIPVAAGTVLGYPGVFFTRPSTVHFEVLTGDAGFMKNPKGDQGGKGLLKIAAGTKLKTRKTTTPPEVKVDMPVGSRLRLVEQPPGDLRKVACAEIVGWTKRSNLGPYDKATQSYALEAPLTTLTTQPGGGATITIDAKKGDKLYYVAEKGDTDRQVRFTLPKAEQDKRTGWAKRDALGDWNGTTSRYTLKAALAVLYKDKPDGAFTFEDGAGTAAEDIFTDALPATDARVCKDKQGKTWQEVECGGSKGWVEIDKDAKLLSPYDWPRWQQIEDPAGFSQDGLCDAKGLLALVDANKDGKVTAEEIKAAVKDPAVAQKLRRLACLHPTEWAGEIPGLDRLSGPPWNLDGASLTATRDYIKKLGFWGDASSAGLPAKDKVWHLHPIGLIEHWRMLSLLQAPPAENQPADDDPPDDEKPDEKPKQQGTVTPQTAYSELVLLCKDDIDGRQRAVKNQYRLEVVGDDTVTVMHRDSATPSPGALVVTCRGENTSVKAAPKSDGYTHYEFDAPFKGAALTNVLEGTFWKNLTQETVYEVKGLSKPITVASYRPNEWKLSIKLPPMRGYKAGAKLETQTQVVVGPKGVAVAQKKTATLEKEVSGWKNTTTQKQKATQTTAVAVTASQMIAAQQLAAKSSTKTKPTERDPIELTCDGVTLKSEIVKKAKEILSIVKVAKQALQIIATIQDRVPKVGWYAEVNVQLFQGSFELEWGMKEYTDYRTYLWIKGNIELVLFAISLEVGVGIECGFKAQVFAKIDGELKIGLSAERIKPGAAMALEVPLKLTITGAVGARFEAGNWVQVEGTFETALEITGTFELHMEKGASIAGSMEWTGLKGKINASVGEGGSLGSYESEQSLVDGQDLGSFKWPDKPYEPPVASRSAIKSILKDKMTEGWDVRVVTPSGQMFVPDKEWTADEIAEKLTAKIDSRSDILRDTRSIEGLAHDIRQRLDVLGKRDWSRDWVEDKAFLNFVNKELDVIITGSYIDPCKELLDRCT
ncbi:pesticin C-terminus-like muramidase [Polyangium sp. y55x31]|uniref:pesticin C-terminus-like muramidase n=1 Tax=Polyangium sp. y55x31 TaxID=3042688 RepID=UPI002482548B|nr:pesticin C-terminus-like muramidase [Polyangium sp. y55x31]MDI1483688.1 pesticin C-terminus-like muramidase [Polyangium sp. y55x31]